MHGGEFIMSEFSNRFRQLKEESGLTLKEFIIMLMIAFSVIPFDITRKLWLKRKGFVIGV